MFKLEGDTIICSPSEQRGTTHVLVLLNFETTRLVGDCLSWTVRAHVPRVIQIEVRYLSKAGGLLTPVGYTKGGVGVSDFSGWSPLDQRIWAIGRILRTGLRWIEGRKKKVDG